MIYKLNLFLSVGLDISDYVTVRSNERPSQQRVQDMIKRYPSLYKIGNFNIIFSLHSVLTFRASFLCKIPVFLCSIKEEAFVSMFGPTNETTVRRIFEIIRNLQLPPGI